MRDQYTEVIIPAHPGYQVIWIDIDNPESDGDPRMVEGVIAWAIATRVGKIDGMADTGTCWVTPVTTDGPATNDHVLRHPHGVFEISACGTYRTLAEAAAEIRAVNNRSRGA